MYGQNLTNQKLYAGAMTATECQSAAQVGVLGGGAPRSPLAEAADTLDQRLQHLQGTIFRLGDRLVPVLLPATAATQGEPVCANATAPVVDSVNAASGMLWNMQRQLDTLIDRLAV